MKNLNPRSPALICVQIFLIMGATVMSPTLRHGMALLRLFFLFSVGCYVALETGLFVRVAQEAGSDLAEPLPHLSTSAAQFPFLGINVALEQYTTKERAAALERLQQHGFGWVRQRLDWGVIEPAPGQYDWRASDAIIQAMVAADLVPVLVLDGSPAWARTSEDLPPTDNPFCPARRSGDLCKFCRRLRHPLSNGDTLLPDLG